MKSRKPILTYTESTKERARTLRRRSTNQEKKLWMFLRRNQLGTHFRRQAPVGQYIVDFLSLESELVVEVDGSQHHTKEGIEADRIRDLYLSARGLTVMRFSNVEVMTDIERVLKRIQQHVRSAREDPPVLP